MGIKVLLNSIHSDLAQYAFTRLLSWRIGALWLLLNTALLLTNTSTQSAPTLMVQATFLLLAITTFRVWDDLADLNYDRLHHPQRTMVVSRHLWPFAAAVIAGMSILAFIRREDPTQLSIFLAMVTLMALLYHSGPGKRVSRPLRAGLVLAKYPLFLLLFSEASILACFVGLAILLIIAMHECATDNRLRETSQVQFFSGIVINAMIVLVLYFTNGAWR